MRKRLHWLKRGLVALLISIALPALAAVAAHALDGSKATDWRTALKLPGVGRVGVGELAVSP